MKSFLSNLALLSLFAFALVSCGGDEPEVKSAAKEIAKMDTNTPEGAFKASMVALKSNDLKSLFKQSMTDEQYNELATEFEKNKASGFSESDKAQFAQTMQMLTADGAEDQLMAMVGPQLEQARAMMPMMLAMGKDQMIMSIKNNPMVPEGQREASAEIAGAVVDWLGENDVLSEDVTRKALREVINTAKALDMTSLDALQNMSFDQALDKGSMALGGLKNVLDVYGISMDDMVNSMDVSNVQVNGDTATMDVAFEIFGKEINQTMNMIKKGDKWISE
ncbi:hypothetical protein [Marinicella sp. W31]|uniref:hypothetical protein n=1 Tax=Marinicella sp. W31 TaxID=3023713 RepID=UPI0037567BD4